MTTSTIDRSAWEQTTRRQRALHALTETISQDPTALPAAVRRARSETFGSLDSLLLAAHAHWVRTFEARLDHLLEQGGYGDQAAVERVWRETAQVLDGTAALLDAYADHEVLARAHADHRRRARSTAGVDLPSRWVGASRPAQRARRPAQRVERAGWRCRARALLTH
ncbi:hypothetical protein KV097_18025 [Mumia sp. zg.B17]|uniref:hypothetical protein n=1 Tax=Mumia sp. zg.B17 TaxID=2855446 RepID=UPI001C6E969C|nr:hypothetical protein [Mumia sp. zg.B17]MBW9207839.1 hypothetical protein [Mumia sp. zg.B17]